MLGQPLSMLLPEVVGFKLTGELREGVTATDLVLITQMLRRRALSAIHQFFGPGLNAMSVADRATIANIWRSPSTARPAAVPDRRAGARLPRCRVAQGRADRARRVLCEGPRHISHPPGARPGIHRHAFERSSSARSPPSLAGPKRPGIVPLADAKARVSPGAMTSEFKQGEARLRSATRWRSRISTSVTGTSSSPRSPLRQHLQSERDDGRRSPRAQRRRQGPRRQALGEDLAGARQPGRRGISRGRRIAEALGSSSASTSSVTAPPASAIRDRWRPPISATIAKHNLVAAAVLSGNRNFEGRVNPDVQANYLASPPLVVAYALAGSMRST